MVQGVVPGMVPARSPLTAAARIKLKSPKGALEFEKISYKGRMDRNYWW